MSDWTSVRTVLGMMSELRWTLLLLGVLFVVALAWWEWRRPRQASGSVERAPPPREPSGTGARSLREPALTLPEIRAREPLVPRTRSAVDTVPQPPQVPILEPAGAEEARAAHDVPVDDAATDEVPQYDPGAGEPGEPRELAEEAGQPPTLAAAAATPVTVPPLPRERLPELPTAEPLVVEWPPDRERRVLTLRLVAPQEERFAGRSLRQALAAEGFVLGQFQIFHKGDEERRAVVSAASLTRPGTFDMDTMDSQHYGGLSLFAVLPGPKPPPQAFEELVFTARNLNERLHGVLQDELGSPLTAARIAVLRDQVRGGANS
jgi:cell division protein ZipA